MKKAYLILAAITSVTLFSCTSDEFVGDSPGTTDQSYGKEITFKSNAGKLTRATKNDGTVAQMLDGQFKVYGVKHSGSAWLDVFKNYVVWSSTTKTTSNPDGSDADNDDKKSMNGWEYVGPSTQVYGLEAPTSTLGSEQYIKYWDYYADKYHFVAGSPVANFTFKVEGDNSKANYGDIISADVTGIAGHISANPTTGGNVAIAANPVYIADPVIVTKEGNNYNKEISFSFTRQQTFVRVGVFETIPGYSISAISFYQYDESSDAWTNTTSNNITLASKTANYFSGSSNATVTVTYDWTAATPTYSYAYASGLTQSKNWFGGELTGVQATTSTESTVGKLYGTDKDMATTGYFPVIPTDVATAQPILIKCDYTLKSLDDSNEEINVKGATAAIPAAFTLWKPNTSYTYLFKISPNTNGTTGTVGTDPEGLYPITFDAAVIAQTDGTNQGTITTVTTPSITTYQIGSVTTEGIKYAINKPIYVTVMTNSTLEGLTTTSAVAGHVQVYKLDKEMTEADLQLTPPSSMVTTTLGTGSENNTDLASHITLEANKYVKFTPYTTGYYAIQYRTQTTPAAYTYKIIKVE